MRGLPEPDSPGGLRLFRAFGIDVFLHWTWLVVAFFMIQVRAPSYSNLLWPTLEYVTLFTIVVLHEFGHALACRSVGGQASRIMLWPLGGVAFVRPPARPGAWLWSIAAGPLVNVALLPPTLLLAMTLGQAETDAGNFFFSIAAINVLLLVFNLLPIYPLDGGQILQSLLWFVIGRGRATVVAGWIGLAGGIGLLGLALSLGSIFMGVVAAFILMQAWGGVRQGRMLQMRERIPRRPGYHCPSCGAMPPALAIWQCERCGAAIDAMLHPLGCPNCGAPPGLVPCIDCGQAAPPGAWMTRASVIRLD